jgi:hypothetical protein
MDTLSEAQTVQALRNAGIPQEIAFEELSFVDDVQYVMDKIEEEKEKIPSLTMQLPEDDEDDTDDDKGGNTDEETQDVV